MTKIKRHFFDTVLTHWIEFVQKFPFYIILISIIAVIFSVNYTINNLGMNTDTRDMLSPDLPWRKHDLEYENLFPQYTNNLIIVIESGTPDQARDAAGLLYKRLLEEKKLFINIYYPPELHYFQESAFLYLDIDELQDLSDNLASIQPFLSRLTEDHSIYGLFSMLGEAVKAKQEGEEIDLLPIFVQINKTFEAIEKNEDYRLSWQVLLGGQNEIKRINREFIILQPLQDYSDFLPTKPAINKIHAITNELNLDKNIDARIRLTGSAALSHDELLSVSYGTEIAVVIAFFLVAIIMLIGVGSFRLVISILFTLVTGLILTAAFATYTVGELNLISVAFAVLYIGLAVDFAIHLCLRYRELLQKNNPHQTALKEATIDVGGSLILCALTTAIGFYAFIPTDYDGVAELGWISGSGMIISLFFTLTLLPALLSLFPNSLKFKETKRSEIAGKFLNLPIRYSGKIKVIFLFIAIVALTFIPKTYFDFNTLNLQSPKNNSVKTFLDLLEDSDTTPWTCIIMADNKTQAKDFSNKLNKINLVEDVIWLDKFVPEQQQDKLLIIDEMNLLLSGISFEENNTTVNDIDRIDTLKKFLDILNNAELTMPEEISLNYNIGTFLQNYSHLSKENQHVILSRLENNLLASLPGRLNALKSALNAAFVDVNSLPDEVLKGWKSEDGHYRLEIFPKENLMDNQAMKQFVEQLQLDFPQVTGTPVINIEAGNVVVTSFIQAFIYALIAITCLLLFLLRSIRDTIYILTPLLLAATLTGASTVVFNMPFNFANVIALPLLLGIGVDSAIHIIHRYRSALPLDNNILATSSARAVLVSGLTTIFSIGNLAFSPHLGTASMGKLLTIGIIMTLLCTLIVLPSMLYNTNSKINTGILPGNKNMPWDARLACLLVYPLKNSRVTPNHLTSIRLLFGILAGISLSTGNFFWVNLGACFFVISNFMDHADGELARLTGKFSNFGHYFDLACDFIVNIILFIGIGVGLTHSILGWWSLPMGIIAGSSVAAIFHMRHEIEKKVGKQQSRQPHFAGFEAEDILYMLPLVTLLNGLIPFLILSSIGAPLFALFVWREYKIFHNLGPDSRDL